MRVRLALAGWLGALVKRGFADPRMVVPWLPSKFVAGTGAKMRTGGRREGQEIVWLL